jgi:hypothetical protein
VQAVLSWMKTLKAFFILHGTLLEIFPHFFTLTRIQDDYNQDNLNSWFHYLKFHGIMNIDALRLMLEVKKVNFYIEGNETKIAIEVLTQSYPESTDYWEGNWLNAIIESEIPGFVAKFGFQLRTDEIKDFADQLKAMDQQLKGKAALYNLDGYIEIVGTMEESGIVGWSAKLCYPAGNGATLRFEFQSDQTHLQQLIQELDGIISVFPVIGAL